MARLRRLGVEEKEVEKRLTALRALQSERAGVSLRYLLSGDFAELAQQRTGIGNPTFMDMKTSFWLSADPLGQDVPCPRDGRLGCALVDWIPRDARREQTHFMSWTWKYSLMQVSGRLNFRTHKSYSGGLWVNIHASACGTIGP